MVKFLFNRFKKRVEELEEDDRKFFIETYRDVMINLKKKT